jgi:hypothetical protein
MLKKTFMVLILVNLASVLFAQDLAELLRDAAQMIDSINGGSSSQPAQAMPAQLPQGEGQSGQVFFRNKTGYSVVEVYISSTSISSWGENIINGVLYNDGTLTVPFGALLSSEKFDVMFVDSDGDRYIMNNVFIYNGVIFDMTLGNYVSR